MCEQLGGIPEGLFDDGTEDPDEDFFSGTDPSEMPKEPYDAIMERESEMSPTSGYRYKSKSIGVKNIVTD